MFDRSRIAEIFYWWLADHNEGQGSKKYARLSKLSKSFRPAPSGPPTDDYDFVDGYYELCTRNGCNCGDNA